MVIKPETTNKAYVGRISGEYTPVLQTGLDFVDWHRCINKKTRVFIKPNFTFPCYKEGITTNPELIRSLVKLLKGQAGSVIVGESDGGNNSFTADQAFEGHDMIRICQESGAELVNLSKLPRETVEGVVHGKKVSVKLPRLLLEEVDCFISLPVLKVHAMTTISLSIKNLWGCHPDPMRCLEHENLSRKLALIARTVRPQLVVIDGTYGLDGHGPIYGQAKKLDMLVIADNPVTADSLGASIMGISLKRAGHILVAEHAGLGTTDLSQVVISDDWEKYKTQFSVKKTPIDTLSCLLFSSSALSKLVMASPLTPIIYGIGGILKTPEEKQVANQFRKYK